MLESQKYAQLTPLEMEILFQMAALERSDGCITYKEIQKISPLREDTRTVCSNMQQPQLPVRLTSIPPDSLSTIPIIFTVNPIF